MTRARNSANLASHGNLFVDITNDRTGIGSVAPAQSLHVAGTAGFHDDVTFTGDNHNATWDRSHNRLKFDADAELRFQDSSFRIYNDGSGTSFIRNQAINLRITSDIFRVRKNNDSTHYINCASNSVSLYESGSKRFETEAYGINVTGTTDTDGLIVSGVATVTTMNVTGVLTYDDVTSVDSVGIVTARQGIHIDDSIVHIGDTNTKIRFPAADTISFETAGSQHLRVASNGNIGIGTANNNPTSKLHVLVDGVGQGIHIANQENLYPTASTGYSDIRFSFRDYQTGGSSGAPAIIRGQSHSAGATSRSSKLIFLTSSSDGTNTPIEKMRIEHDGKVGIGSAIPAQLLDIASTAPNIRFTDTVYGHAEIDGNSADLKFNADKGNAKADSQITFFVDNDEKVRIGASGQIGIAGANYGSSGQVLTSGGASGSVSWSTITGTTINNNADNRIITGSGTANTLEGEANLTFDGSKLAGTEPFIFGGFGSVSATQGCRITGGSGSHPACLSLDGGSSPTLEFGSKSGETIIGTNSYGNSPMNFKTGMGIATLSGGTTRMSIDSSGRVLIGSTAKAGDSALQVYTSDRLHPAIRTNAGNANGYTMFGDAYQADESQVNMGIAYSSASLVISVGCKVNTSSDDAYVSSQGTYSTRPTALRLDTDGSLSFLNTSSASTTPTDNAVTLTERLRIDSSGRIIQNYAALPSVSSNLPYAYFAPAKQNYGGVDLTMNLHDDASNALGNGGGLGFSGNNSSGSPIVRAAIRGNVESTSSNAGYLTLLTRPASGNSAERLRITSMGDIYAGNESGYAIFDNSTTRPRFQFRQGTGTNRGFALIETRGDANSMALYIAKSREGNGTGVINSGDQLGSIQFTGSDGTNQVTGGQILAWTSGTIAADRIPTNLSFYTHPDSTAGKAERLRIDDSGDVTIQTTDVRFGGVGILRINSGSTSGALNLDGGSSNHGGEINLTGGSNGGRIQFRTGQGSGQQSEKMRLDENGRLLIATTTTSGTSTSGDDIVIGSIGDSTSRGITFATTTDATIRWADAGDNAMGRIQYLNNTDVMSFHTSNVPRITITGTGNVGINESSPTSQLVVRATSDDNPGIILYRESGGGDVASINWKSSTGTNAQINYRGGSGDEGLQFRTSIGNGNQGSMKERFRVNHGTSQGVNIYVLDDSSNSPTTDKTALLIHNGIGGGDIGGGSMPTHIDWAWQDSNPNDRPQCRISGNVGNGGDPNSLQLEGKGFLTFHCSDTNSSAYNDIDPPQRLRIAHNGTFTGSSSNNISDQRLKENIATITDPIAKIKALKGRTFTWKTEASMREGTHYGFIAQEVESVISDLIVDDTGIRVFDKDDNLQPSNVITPPVGGGYAKSVDSDGVIPVLVEALKEALSKIETLETKVAALGG